MRLARPISLVLLLLAVALGTLSDVPRTHAPLTLGGYRVLTADFHVHSFPLSWGSSHPGTPCSKRGTTGWMLLQ